MIISFLVFQFDLILKTGRVIHIRWVPALSTLTLLVLSKKVVFPRLWL